MKVRFLKNHNGYQKGDEYDTNDTLGRALIDEGIAEDTDKEKTVHPDAVEFIEQGKKKTEKAERAEAKEKVNDAGPGKRK